MTGLLLVTWIASVPGPLEEVQRHFDRHGRATPRRDPALEQAAARLADLALDHPAAEISAQASVTAALSAAGGWDPAPRALVFRARPSAAALEALRADPSVAEAPASHAGAAMASSGTLGTVVVLLSERLAELDPFPRSLPGPVRAQSLCGRLLGDLVGPELFVTGPDGAVARRAATLSDRRFCVDVPIARPGRHVVEIMARSPARGPEVAALFFADVAGATAPRAEQAFVEPPNDAAAREAIRTRVSQLRAAHGVHGLAQDPALDRVAQAYAERMASRHFFAHVSPDGDDLRKRLQAAGYAYLSAGENLGSAPGPLAAHFGIEHSPGHRKNLLEPSHASLGVGIAWEELGDGRRQAVVVELLARPAVALADPTSAAYRALDERRSSLGLPALKRSELLEQMARAHVRAALAAQAPRASLPGSRPLADRVLEATNHRSVAVDVLVADSPGQIASAHHVADPRARLSGAGLAQGQGRWWMVLITAEPATK